MKNYKNIIGRNSNLFKDDINANEDILCEIIESSKFLILGGSGSIGQAVTKEIFKRDPIKIHVVDINENTLTELVRDIRSSYGYIKGEFKTFCIDIGSKEYLSFVEHDDLGIISDGALLWDSQKGILWLGETSKVPKKLIRGAKKIKYG